MDQRPSDLTNKGDSDFKLEADDIENRPKPPLSVIASKEDLGGHNSRLEGPSYMRIEGSQMQSEQVDDLRILNPKLPSISQAINEDIDHIDAQYQLGVDADQNKLTESEKKRRMLEIIQNDNSDKTEQEEVKSPLITALDGHITPSTDG